MDEFVIVMTKLWGTEPFSFTGKYYRVDNGEMPLKIGRKTPPVVYATSSSPEGMETIARYCDCWFAPEVQTRTFEESYAAVRANIAKMHAVSDRIGRKVRIAMQSRVFCTEDLSQADAQIAALDAYGNIRRYNKSAAAGVGPCLIGKPQVIADRIRAYEDLGIELLMLNFQPIGEGLENFGDKVVPLLKR
jgi:FMNH2-dependent dimethyl sulfone monooxygenase